MAMPSAPVTAVSGGSLDRDRPKRSMLARALAILCVFGPSDCALTLTELAQRASLSKATAHRLVTELVEWGLLERSGRELRLGERLSVLGSRVLRHRVLREAAVPLLIRASGSTGGCAYLFVRDGRGVVQLDRIGTPGTEELLPDERDRERLAAHAAMAAVAAFDRPARSLSPAGQQNAEWNRHLTTIRSLGYAVVERRENPDRLLAVACPVLVPSAGAVAAIAVIGATPNDQVGRIAPVVLAVAGALARALGETADVEWAS